MPTVDQDGVTLRYTVEGEGPLVVLVPDAAVGPWMWGWVLEDLVGPYRVLTFALRGTDGSDRAPDEEGEGGAGGYSVPVQVADLEAVVSAVDARRVHVVGCGLGGQIAVAYAADRGRVRSLTLIGTGPTLALDEDLRETLCGADPIASLVPYVDTGLDRLDEERLRTWRERDDPPPAVRTQQLAAAGSVDLPPLHEVTVPTRVLHGEDDEVWDVPGATTLADALPRGRLHIVRAAPHLLPVVTPRVVADEIVGVLEETGAGVS